MLVSVQLLLTFEEKTRHGKTPFNLELSPGDTVARALEALSISSSAPKVIIVNGRVADPSRELFEGDQLTVFPAVAGG